MKTVATLLLTLSFTALAERVPDQRTDPKLAPIYGRVCDERAGRMQTCTLQCDPGTLGPWERLITPSMAGVQVCAVRRCSCEPNQAQPGFTSSRSGFEAQDSSEDIAFVIFGVDRLLGTAVRPTR